MNGVGQGEQALARFGFTGERLMKLCHRIANDVLRQRGANVGDRYEDLVSYLQVAGLEAALRYDPSRSHTSYGSRGGDPFESYISDILEKRVTDWWRRKSEGWGDRRYGNDDRLVYSPMDEDVDTDVDFESLISAGRLARWHRAADTVGWSFTDFVVITLDKAASQIEKSRAA